MPWEKLSEDTILTCGKTPVGWSTNPNDADRCNKKAVWMFPDKCSCGSVDMTRIFCSEHFVAEAKPNEWCGTHKVSEDLARQFVTWLFNAIDFVRKNA